MKTDVYAENGKGAPGDGSIPTRFLSIGFPALLFLSLISGPVKASTRADLDTHIQNVEQITSSLTVSVPAALTRLKTQTNTGTPANQTVTWPISYVASTFSVAGLQFDLALPSSFTVVSVSAGPAAIAAGKSVTWNASTDRGLVFGLNQTALGTGVVALVQLQIGQVSHGLYSMALVNPVAVTGAGTSILISATSGTIGVP
jgi:hypothetical protein